MSGLILRGSGRDIQAASDEHFLHAIKNIPAHMAARLAFMTPEHHEVRDFVVREIPRQQQPISPQQIAQVTGLALRRVTTILDELEKHLFFLVRNLAGHVSWAFPVTTARTRHRLTLSTGEHTFGA